MAIPAKRLDYHLADPCFRIYNLVRMLMIASVSRQPAGQHSYANHPKEREMEELVAYPSRTRFTWLQQMVSEAEAKKGVTVPYRHRALKPIQLRSDPVPTSDILDNFATSFISLEREHGAPL